VLWDLENGTTALAQMLTLLLPHGADLIDSVLQALRTPLSTEELHRPIAAVLGRAPFPAERVEQYLNTFDPTPEGPDHGDG
jgi:hypothetical protein